MGRINSQRVDDLLASVTPDLLNDLPQTFNNQSLRVEPILLEMVRPDPVQPRRVMPEHIHIAFHNNQATPTQALRELVQLVQIAARQHRRPFSSVLELLPNGDDERSEDAEAKLSPEEQLLRDLVNLAITIRDDGQVNPLTVVDVSQGVMRLFRVETVQETLNKAKTWLQIEIERIAFLVGLERKDAVRDLFQSATDFDEMELSDLRAALAKIGIKGRVFNDLLKAARSKNGKQESDEMPQILGDDIPLLSPALGFQREVALVTVSVIERTKANRLNTQPYLVTSSRELIRVSDAQIIPLDGKEVALRVLPEGSDFLMRWRFSDIQCFLKGETIDPGQVFKTVHELITQYVDFRSDVESAILALWTIGTYFYTMFLPIPIWR